MAETLRLIESVLSDRRKVLVAAVPVIVLALALRTVSIDWSYSNNGVDEGVMLQRAMLVDMGYGLYTDIPCDQAPLGFFIGALAGGEVVGSRMMTAFISLGAVVAMMALARRSGGQTSMTLAGVLLAVDFALVRESRLFSLDAISAAFMAFSLLAFGYYTKGNSRAAVAAAGLLIGLSVAAKLIGAVGLLGLVAWFAFEMYKTRRRALALDLGILLSLSAVPMLAFLLVLGPSDMLQGMVFDQGHREFEPFLKLSVAAFFGLNLAYLLPFARARALWFAHPESRYLLFVSAALLLFMLVQPLIYLHHMVFLSYPLAVLAGLVLPKMLGLEQGDSCSDKSAVGAEKRIGPWRRSCVLPAVVLVVGLLISSGLSAYGPAAQGQPLQERVAERVMSYPSWSYPAWVISGDPLIASYMRAPVPPEVANVAYRQFPELTEEMVEEAVLEYDVSVVIVCYRLSEFAGLPAFLEENGYTEAETMFDGTASLDLFQEGIGNVTIYLRDDLYASIPPHWWMIENH